MTGYDAAELLAHLRSLTGEVYDQSKVTAWSQALIDVAFEDARDAVTALVADPAVMTVAVPQIRSWLRSRAARAGALESMRPVVHGCGCTTFTLCEPHRSVGLNAIALIRADRGWRAPADREPDFRYTPIQEDS